MSTLFNNWNDVVNPGRVEMVFEGRNKEYGAYVIRKEYNKRLSTALIIAVSFVALSIAIPIVVSLISKSDFMTKNKMETEVILAEPPPIDKSTPPPPPVEPPPPVQKTIQFTPPKVVKDEELKEPPPTQEEVKEVQVATKTVEGSKDVVELPPENPIVAESDEALPWTAVEEPAQFPGGEAKLQEYMQKNIKYPPIARENGIQGTVYITFIVNKEGKVQDVKLLRGIGGGCDEEALRVARTIPDWRPAKQNGRPVKIYVNMPVRFNLK